MKTEFIGINPVLPSADIARDIDWYTEKVGLRTLFYDHMYAVLYRENICIHLQWHADTTDDPLLGGSVIRIHVKNIRPLFNEFVERGTVAEKDFKTKTPWETNEFGFYDLNKNAIFFMEDLS
ncbi:MAG: glyoxalase/bleomycin resistance/extradiol dioxygenase family protein [Terrimonas sp.]|nr:glyoxalase/bleomycin resistance/extradiol dioxygenase family protein [Terrimonas sp.]